MRLLLKIVVERSWHEDMGVVICEHSRAVGLMTFWETGYQMNETDDSEENILI